jgi:aminoglycoside phosphotransferase (APT) family kinase protein
MPSLDIEDHVQLTAYLIATARVGAGVTVACQTLAGGVSNRTVLVQLGDGRTWVLKQALERLRVAETWLSDPARIDREAEGLRWLAQLAPAGTITPLIFHDPAENLLAMQAVPAPHENYKSLLLGGRLSRQAVIDLARQFGTLLGVIHRAAAVAGAEVARAFDDRSFFLSLRLDPYYRFTAAREPAAAAFYSELIDATAKRRFTLVHGDYSPKNVLVRNDRLVLLDHEVIHFGDGAFDVGFALTHLLSKACHVAGRLTDYRDAALRFWQAYHAEVSAMPWADDLEPFCVRHALGCLLARVSGKSPLEYLSTQQRDRQRAVALKLMVADTSETVPDLVERFVRQEI